MFDFRTPPPANSVAAPRKKVKENPRISRTKLKKEKNNMRYN